MEISCREEKRVKGTCLWFSDNKGYGFVQSDDGASCMVHYKNIREHGFRRLYPGQRVNYYEVMTDRGLLAKRLKYERDYSYVNKEV